MSGFFDAVSVVKGQWQVQEESEPLEIEKHQDCQEPVQSVLGKDKLSEKGERHE